MTQISIKTKAYAQNPNYNAIVDALAGSLYTASTFGGTFNSTAGGVTIITDAPRSFVEGISYSPSAVQIRG
jgi:hypothetical protein